MVTTGDALVAVNDLNCEGLEEARLSKYSAVSQLHPVKLTFMRSESFKSALERKMSLNDNGGVLDLRDVNMIASAFDTKIRDDTDNFNNYREWTMNFTLPPDVAGRDIILRFPVVKMMKALYE